MMQYEEQVVEKMAESDDPVKMGIQYAMIGNYIDFGAMHSVDEKYLQKLLDTVSERPINEAV